jgi:hypothetical protein
MMFETFWASRHINKNTYKSLYLTVIIHCFNVDYNVIDFNFTNI